MVKEWALVVCHTTMVLVEQLEISPLATAKPLHSMQLTTDKLVVEETLIFH